MDLKSKQKPNSPESYLHWVEKYWSVRGKPLDLGKYTGGDHTYVEKLYEDQHPDICFKKSAQAGATERMMTEALWLPDQYKENSLYVFPTSGTVADLVQERLDEPINNSKYLSGVSGRAKKIMKKQADKVGLKRMSKGFIYFRGANKPTQITSVSADAVFVDELDRMLVESIPYLRKRMMHSKRKWMRWASTPTIPNFGIDVKFEESDQHFLQLKCPCCNEWQVLDFWDNVNKENKQVICSKCKKKIIPYKCQLEWVPKYPNKNKRGYHISQLYSPLLDIEELIEESEREAEWEIMQFMNQSLGLTYEPKGGKITEQDMDSCKRDYTIPSLSDFSFMGVDVGKKFNVVIIDKEKLLYCGECRTVDELVGLAEQYKSKCAVIDGNPEGRAAEEFCIRAQGNNHMCWYVDTSGFSKGEWFKTEELKVTTGRTMSLDKYNNENKKQKIKFPKNLESYPEFKKQLKALTRVQAENKKGDIIAQYLKTGEDHYRHAYNYANLAKEIFSKVGIPEIFTM